MRRLGIRIYLFLALAMTVTLPLLGLGVVQVRTDSSAAITQAEQDARLRADETAARVQVFMERRVEGLEVLAQQLEALGLGDSPRVQAQLDATRSVADAYAFLYVAGLNAVSRITSPPTAPDGSSNAGVDYSDRDYALQVLSTGEPAVSRVQLGRRSGVPNVQIAVPLHDSRGVQVGFLEGSVDLAPLGNLLASLAGPDTQVVVMDGEGRVISDGAGRFEALKVLESSSFFGPSTVAGLWVDQVFDPNGVDSFGVALGFPVMGSTWNTVVWRPRTTLLEVERRSRARVLIALSMALALALGFAALISAWVARPILVLVRVFKALGAGNLGARTPSPKTLDARELVVLMAAVDGMAGQLQVDRDEQVATLAELKRANDQLGVLEAALKHSADAFLVVNRKRQIVYFNPAFEDLFGLRSQETLGSDPWILLPRTPEANPERDREREKLLLEGKTWREEYSTVRSDGEEVLSEVMISPFRDHKGGLLGHVVLLRDVGERKLAEERLRRSERMASLGTMAAGVAHELNNPLAYVNSNLSFLADWLSDGQDAGALGEVEQAIQETRSAVDRAAEVVGGLKSLTREDELGQERVDVNALLESCLAIGANEIRHRALLVQEFEDVGCVLGRSSAISQVLLNLIVNAAQAIEPGHVADNVLRVASSRTDQGLIQVVIQDTGCGIAPEILERAYEPFFTTKPVGVGTGLGLSICLNLVQSMGGELVLESEVGKGTTATVTLPGSACENVEPVSRGVRSLERIRVLVVDDEVGLARAFRRMLKDYEVEVAHSGREALSHLRLGGFDAVLCDVMMPEVTGVELHQQVSRYRPGLADRFIFTTGGTFVREQSKYLAESGQPILTKPFRRSELFEALARVVSVERSGTP